MTTEEPDHYATLQVAPTAEPAVIAAAYRALARRYHPDVAGTAGEEAMRRINAAWEILGNPRRRAEYDRQRSVAAATGSNERAAATTRSPEPPAEPASAATAANRPTSTSRGAPTVPDPYGPAGPPPGRPQGSVLSFGLFRGWSIGEIARVDPGYLEWLEGKREGRPYLREIDEALRATGWRRRPGDSPKDRGGGRRGLTGRWRGRP